MLKYSWPVRWALFLNKLDRFNDRFADVIVVAFCVVIGVLLLAGKI
jgi:hypothetical protein